MCATKRSGLRFLTIGGAALVTLAGGSARASDPFALYAVPTAVELLPSEANATQVVVHGAFLFLTVTQKTTANAMYSEPKCGAMYFQCPSGQEDLCRMQWSDIKNAIQGGYCAGFGTLNMLSAATLRDEGSPLGTPDKWEMGMGVAIASSLGNQCPKARALICPGTLTDGGVPDAGAGGAGGRTAGGGGVGGIAGGGGAGGKGGAGGAGVAPGTGGSVSTGGLGGVANVGGASGTGGVVGSGGGPAGTGGVASATGGNGTGGTTASGGVGGGGAVDAAVGGNKKTTGGGCTVGDASRSGGGLFAIAISLAAVLASRRRPTRR